ncbi:hypothetical protein [Streptomyces sp. NPDC047097]|uniref:hypothetical protein n=1 Tax=Streptomyces sp. NPDC047097 TaxID=3155260 RepID=UPI0033D69DE4
MGGRATAYDAFHAARTRTTLAALLYATAMVEVYPGEVAASSSCDGPLFGLLTARLRLRPVLLSTESMRPELLGARDELRLD